MFYSAAASGATDRVCSYCAPGTFAASAASSTLSDSLASPGCPSQSASCSPGSYYTSAATGSQTVGGASGYGATADRGCTPCPSGFYSNTGVTGQTSTYGTAIKTSSSEACTLCVGSARSDAGSTACTCRDTHAAWAAGSNTCPCTADAGYYSNGLLSTDTTCLQCATGSGDTSMLQPVGEVLAAIRRAKSEAKASQKAVVELAVVEAPAEVLAMVRAAEADLRDAGSITEFRFTDGATLACSVTLAPATEH